MNNYRPVSNVCFIAKVLEKLVLSQVSSYLNSHNLHNTCQSAYRAFNSTETALLKVVNDLFLSFDKGNISVQALFDFSSALDTIDHPILVHRLHSDFGFTDAVLQWISSYLADRTQFFSLYNHCYAFAPVHSGVPQGSVHGPMLFTMYIVHTMSVYLIIVLPLLQYTQVFLRVQFLALCLSPCMLSLFLPLLTHTQSDTIHLPTTYNYRCLLPQIE